MYVPVTGSVCASMKAPAGAAGVTAREVSTELSGFRIETVPTKSVSVTLRLTRSLAKAEKVKRLAWPGTVVAPVVGVPSVGTVAVVSAGTS